MSPLTKFKIVIYMKANGVLWALSSTGTTFMYEKLHGETVDPHTLLDFAAELSKDLEDHLLEDA
ncbi:hypothetical protein TIFTF001_013267 [Ficus carica]|uniref:Uncharacterized protein n=1 Tax=Ficus carica TaxID=3494 RepID=A0AA88A1P4_FICCA|nr:hypothetical protein TIFTF001_013267 [Ficus carica]